MNHLGANQHSHHIRLLQYQTFTIADYTDRLGDCHAKQSGSGPRRCEKNMILFSIVPKSVMLVNAGHNAPSNGSPLRSVGRNTALHQPQQNFPGYNVQNFMYASDIPARDSRRSRRIGRGSDVTQWINDLRTRAIMDWSSIDSQKPNPSHTAKQREHRALIDGFNPNGDRISWPHRRTSSFRLSTLRRLKEEHLLLHDGIVLQHAERAVRTRADHGAVVARHGHGDEPDGDGSRLGCWEKVLVDLDPRALHGACDCGRNCAVQGDCVERMRLGCVCAPFFAILLDVSKAESVVRWLENDRGDGENVAVT